MDSSMLWSGFRGALATVDHDMVRERLLRQGSLASVASEDGEMDATEIEAMIAAEVAAVETKMRDGLMLTESEMHLLESHELRETELATQAIEELRKKLEDGHMLSASELSQLEEAESRAAAEQVEQISALRARLAAGHMLTAAELAQLEQAEEARESEAAEEVRQLRERLAAGHMLTTLELRVLEEADREEAARGGASSDLWGVVREELALTSEEVDAYFRELDAQLDENERIRQKRGGGEERFLRTVKQAVSHAVTLAASPVLGPAANDAPATAATLDGSAAASSQQQAAAPAPLPETAKERATRIWRAIDVDGSGFLDRDELLRHVMATGVDGATAERVFTAIDANRDGKITLNEWLAVYSADSLLDQAVSASDMAAAASAEATLVAPAAAPAASGAATSSANGASMQSMQEQIRAALATEHSRVIDLFRSWDRAGNGRISKLELRRAVLAVGYDAPRADVDALFDSIDVDRSGTIEYRELYRVLKPDAAVTLDPLLMPGGAGEIALRAQLYSKERAANTAIASKAIASKAVASVASAGAQVQGQVDQSGETTVRTELSLARARAAEAEARADRLEAASTAAVAAAAEAAALAAKREAESVIASALQAMHDAEARANAAERQLEEQRQAGSTPAQAASGSAPPLLDGADSAHNAACAAATAAAASAAQSAVSAALAAEKAAAGAAEAAASVRSVRGTKAKGGKGPTPRKSPPKGKAGAKGASPSKGTSPAKGASPAKGSSPAKGASPAKGGKKGDAVERPKAKAKPGGKGGETVAPATATPAAASRLKQAM